MSNAYINIYHYIKNYKLDDDAISMLPGVIVSIALVAYYNFI